MATSSRTRTARPSHPPLWLVEGLDIIQRKRWVVAAVVVVVVALGALASLVFPATIPATAGVGAAVGVAALLLGLAAAVASDATELIVRGPRHVAAAGGELVAVLPRDPSVAAAGPLAAAIEEVREPGAPLLLAFATAGRDARRTVAWTDAIARSLVGRELGVLRVDLASGRSEEPGLLEVVRDGVRLADVVEFEPGVKLARLRAGGDHGAALGALTELPSRLPRDLDILLVSLPTAVSRPVVAAAAALDHVLVVVERDRTSRVDLIASLDALEAAGTNAQVVLLDTSTAMRLSPPVEATPEETSARRAIASTVGTSPTVGPGSDVEPVEVSDEPVEVDPDALEATAPPEVARDEDEEAGEVEEPVAGVVTDHVDADDADDADDVDVAAVEHAVEHAFEHAVEDEGALAVEEPAADEVDSDVHDEAFEDEFAGLGEEPPAPEEQLPEPEDEPVGTEEELAAPDDGAQRRDVDLLEAAAAATAMSITDAQQQPLHERFDAAAEAEDESPAPEELPQPFAEPRVEAPVDLSDDPAATDADVADPERADPQAADPADLADPDEREPDRAQGPEVDVSQHDTDRIPRVGEPEPPRLNRADPGEEDMLRTTAQLAILTQDIDLRDAPAREAAPSATETVPSATDAAHADADADADTAARRARDIVRELIGEGEAGAGAADTSGGRHAAAEAEEATRTYDDEAR